MQFHRNRAYLIGIQSENKICSIYLSLIIMWDFYWLYQNGSVNFTIADKFEHITASYFAPFCSRGPRNALSIISETFPGRIFGWTLVFWRLVRFQAAPFKIMWVQWPTKCGKEKYTNSSMRSKAEHPIRTDLSRDCVDWTPFFSCKRTFFCLPLCFTNNYNLTSSHSWNLSGTGTWVACNEITVPLPINSSLIISHCLWSCLSIPVRSYLFSVFTSLSNHLPISTFHISFIQSQSKLAPWLTENSISFLIVL